jgi:hypothetical protein
MLPLSFNDTGYFALETHVEEIAAAMREFLAKTTAWSPIRIQTCMESPTPPPEKRQSPSPTLVYIIVGVIAAAFVMFLVLRPS